MKFPLILWAWFDVRAVKWWLYAGGVSFDTIPITLPVYRRNLAAGWMADHYSRNQLFMVELTELAAAHSEALHFISTNADGLTQTGRFFLNHAGLQKSLGRKVANLDLRIVADWPRDLKMLADEESQNWTNDFERTVELSVSAQAFATKWGLITPWGAGLVVLNLLEGYSPL